MADQPWFIGNRNAEPKLVQVGDRSETRLTFSADSAAAVRAYVERIIQRVFVTGVGLYVWNAASTTADDATTAPAAIRPDNVAVDDPGRYEISLVGGATIPGSVVQYADFAALRAASAPGDKTLVSVLSPPWTGVYSASDGAGFADDGTATGATTIKPDSILTAANGRYYTTASAPIVPTKVALLALRAGSIASVHMQAFASLGDGGGDVFDWDATRVGENDGGRVLSGWVRRTGDTTRNVLHFGARGNFNGTTGTDDYAAFAAAAASAGASGCVFVPVSVGGNGYKLGSTWSYNGSIVFENGSTRVYTYGTPGIQAGTGSTHAKWIGNGGHVYNMATGSNSECLRALGVPTVVTDVTAAIAKGQAAITIQSSSGLAAGDFIYIYNKNVASDLVELNRVKSVDGPTAITLSAPATNIYIYPAGVRFQIVRMNDADVVSHFEICGFNVHGNASCQSLVALFWTRNARIHKNKIFGPTQSTAGRGILLDDSSSRLCTDVLVDDNDILDVDDHGVEWYSTSSNVTVRDNRIWRSYTQGIMFRANGMVVNNRLFACARGGASYAAIGTDGGGRSLVQGNQVFGSSGDGIRVAAGDDITIANNYLENFLGVGIFLYNGDPARINNPKVSGNVLRGNAVCTNGIVSAATDASIHDNDVTAVSGPAYQEAGSGTRFYKNVGTGCSGVGLEILGAATNVFIGAGNVLTGNSATMSDAGTGTTGDFDTLVLRGKATKVTGLRWLSFSENPGTIANAAQWTSTQQTLTGVLRGDLLLAGLYPAQPDGVTVSAICPADDKVKAVILNNSGAGWTPGACQIRIGAMSFE